MLSIRLSFIFAFVCSCWILQPSHSWTYVFERGEDAAHKRALVISDVGVRIDQNQGHQNIDTCNETLFNVSSFVPDESPSPLSHIDTHLSPFHIFEIWSIETAQPVLTLAVSCYLTRFGESKIVAGIVADVILDLPRSFISSAHSHPSELQIQFSDTYNVDKDKDNQKIVIIHLDCIPWDDLHDLIHAAFLKHASSMHSVSFLTDTDGSNSSTDEPYQKEKPILKNKNRRMLA